MMELNCFNVLIQGIADSDRCAGFQDEQLSHASPAEVRVSGKKYHYKLYLRILSCSQANDIVSEPVLTSCRNSDCIDLLFWCSVCPESIFWLLRNVGNRPGNMKAQSDGVAKS